MHNQNFKLKSTSENLKCVCIFTYIHSNLNLLYVTTSKQGSIYTHMRNPVMLVWGSLRLTPIISGPLSLDWKAGYSILENV